MFDRVLALPLLLVLYPIIAHFLLILPSLFFFFSFVSNPDILQMDYVCVSLPFCDHLNHFAVSTNYSLFSSNL